MCTCVSVILPAKSTSVVYRIKGDITAGRRALSRIIYISIHYYLLARVYKNVVITLSCQYSCSCLLIFLMLNSGLFIVIIREGPAYIVLSYLTLLIQTYPIWLPFPAPIGAMLDFACLSVLRFCISDGVISRYPGSLSCQSSASFHLLNTNFHLPKHPFVLTSRVLWVYLTLSVVYLRASSLSHTEAH